MQGLTKRQREIIDFIEGYATEKRYAPSYREVKEHFGFSSLGSVYNHIRILKRKGLIPNDTKGARSLNVQNIENEELVEIPLIGKIVKGMPIVAFSQIRTHFLSPNLVPKDKDCYLLQVEGNHLNEEMIFDGDLLIVEPRTPPRQGEIAIALVNETIIWVKRFFSEPPYLRIESIMPEVQSLRLREDHVLFQGVVISLIRRF